MSGFWDKWPSLLVEICSGVLFVSGAIAGLVLATTNPVAAVCVLATAGSILYEVRYDPAGFSFPDVVQRELGIALATVVYWAIR